MNRKRNSAAVQLLILSIFDDKPQKKKRCSANSPNFASGFILWYKGGLLCSTKIYSSDKLNFNLPVNSSGQFTASGFGFGAIFDLGSIKVNSVRLKIQFRLAES